MNLFRRLSLSRLLALVAGALVVLGAGAAIAVAALSDDGPTPPPKPLARALQQGLGAPDLPGVTARVQFTNKLIDGSSLVGRDPILTGATGRLWASADGKVRLELQSSTGQDAQIVYDGKVAWLYDARANTVYRMAVPAEKQSRADRKRERAEGKQWPPALRTIRRELRSARRDADISRAIPSNVAGRPAYTVEISPKHDAGLLGGAQVAWDAVRGVPLRAAIYADGQSDPVIELKATDISFGAVPASAFAIAPPKDAKVVKVAAPSGKDERAGKKSKRGSKVAGVRAVQRKLGFPLVAPRTLVGLPRQSVRLVQADGERGAIVTYGKGLGGIAVLQAPADAGGKAASKGSGDGEEGRDPLPTISIDGVTGRELATALGTVVTFERNGVSYTVIGSVPPAAAEAAARELF